MAKKQKRSNYEQNPPQQTRRELPGPEAKMRSTSLAMDDPRYDLGPESQLNAVNAVASSRWLPPDATRMTFPSTTAGKNARDNYKGRG